MSGSVDALRLAINWQIGTPIVAGDAGDGSVTRDYHLGRLWDSFGLTILVIASVERDGGRLVGWEAFVGAHPSRAATLEEMVLLVRAFGSPMNEGEARAFFRVPPFLAAPYRPNRAILPPQ